MVSLGMWACQWRELKPFAFGGSGNSKGKQPAVDTGGGAEAEGEGFEMGNPAMGGRGRDGASAYEMVGMAPKEPA